MEQFYTFAFWYMYFSTIATIGYFRRHYDIWNIGNDSTFLKFMVYNHTERRLLAMIVNTTIFWPPLIFEKNPLFVFDEEI